MATHTFRNASTGLDFTFSGQTNDPGLPSGVQANDLLFGVFAVYTFLAAQPTCTIPSGWTQIPGANYNLSLSGGALLGNVKLAYKVAAGSDATEFSSDQPNSSFVGIIHGYDNTKTSGPLQTHTRNVITSSLNYTATGITTDQAHELLIWVAWNDQSGATFTPPDGMTERVDTANAFATADLLNQAAAGASGDKTGVASASGNGEAYLVAFYSEDSSGSTPAPPRQPDPVVGRPFPYAPSTSRGRM
jgi:hypothetical protein